MKRLYDGITEDQRELLNQTLILPEAILWRYQPPQEEEESLFSFLMFSAVFGATVIAIMMALMVLWMYLLI